MITSVLKKSFTNTLAPRFWFSKAQKQNKPLSAFNRHKLQLDDENKFTEQDRMRIYKNTRDIYLHGMTAQEINDSAEGVKRVFRAQNATPHEILKNKMAMAVKKFQKSPLDTGSAAVQCACMSERIIQVINHCKQMRQDKKAGRYLQFLIQKRRKMLNYLMINDYHYYKWVCMQYAIPEVFPKYAHHTTNFKGQFNGTAGI